MNREEGEGQDIHVGVVGGGNDLRTPTELSASMSMPIFTQSDVHSEICMMEPIQTVTVGEEKPTNITEEAVNVPMLPITGQTETTNDPIIVQYHGSVNNPREPISSPPANSFAAVQSSERGGLNVNLVPCVVPTVNACSFSTDTERLVLENGIVLQRKGPVELDDAVRYIEAVKLRFINQPEVYNSFVDIMRTCKDDSTNISYILNCINELFQGNPDLVLGFNIFIPDEYKPINTRNAITQLAMRHQSQSVSRRHNDQNGQLNLLTRVVTGVSTPYGSDVNDPNNQALQGHVLLPHQGGALPIIRIFAPGQGQSCLADQNQGSSSHASNIPQHGNLVSPNSHANAAIYPVNPIPFSTNVANVTPEEYVVVPERITHYQQMSEQQVEALAASTNQQQEFQQAIGYVNKIKQRLSPEKYRQFLEILHYYRKQQRKMAEPPATSSDTEPNEQEIYLKITKLFEDHQDLLQEFIKYIPTSSSIIEPALMSQQLEQLHMNDHQDKSGSTSTNSNLVKGPQTRHFIQQPSKVKHNQLPNPSVDAQKVTADPVSSHVKVNSKPRKSSSKLRLSSSLQFDGIEGFITFLKVVRELLRPAHYEDFLRILLLYNKDVISRPELLDSVEELLHKDQEMLRWFKKFVDTDPVERESSTHFDLLESSTINQSNCEEVGIYELDLSNCRRLGQSYCQAPKTYRPPKCFGRTGLCDEVLNDEWLSVPEWTEGAGCGTKKMPYEELMYKVEEERFELDFLIETNTEAIKYLTIIDDKMRRMSTKELAEFQLDDCIGSRSTIHLRAVNRIYGDEAAPKIVEGLKHCPQLAVPIVLKRLKQKDEEWRKVQKVCNNIWKEQTDRYYLKSLDHVGPRFKQADGKALRRKPLIAEVQELHEDVQHEKSCLMTSESIAGSIDKPEKNSKPLNLVPQQ